MKKISKVVSLGATCGPFVGLNNIIAKERYPFDGGLIHHDALNNILKSKFVNILYPDQNVEMDNIIRIGFYYPYEGFFFGHQDKKELPQIEDRIRRRCKRFLSLKFCNDKILFVRERHFFGDDIFEAVSSEEIFTKIEDEYFSIYDSLKEFGFKDFEFLYIINSPLQTLDGYITFKEGYYNNILFVDKIEDGINREKWKLIGKIIKENFDLSDLNKV